MTFSVILPKLWRHHVVILTFHAQFLLDRSLCDEIVTVKRLITSCHEVFNSLTDKASANVIPDVLSYRTVYNWRIKHEIFIVFLADNAELQSCGSDLVVYPRLSTVPGVDYVHQHVPLYKA